MNISSQLVKIPTRTTFLKVSKSVLPANNAANGDEIMITARMFTDAYETNRCALDEDNEDCQQDCFKLTGLLLSTRFLGYQDMSLERR